MTPEQREKYMRLITECMDRNGQIRSYQPDLMETYLAVSDMCEKHMDTTCGPVVCSCYDITLSLLLEGACV